MSDRLPTPLKWQDLKHPAMKLIGEMIDKQNNIIVNSFKHLMIRIGDLDNKLSRSESELIAMKHELFKIRELLEG